MKKISVFVAVVLLALCAFAACAVKNFAVDFNSQGGSDIAQQVIEKDKKAQEPTAPQRQGYTFGGWFTNSACTEGAEYNFNSPVSGDITLYAKWDKNPWKVSFKKGDGTLIEEKSVKEGESATLPSYLEGYEIVGFYSDAAFMLKYDESALICADTVIYIKLLQWTNANEFNWKLADDGQSYAITRYTGVGAQVVIPSVYNGKPVKTIGGDAFYNCILLTSVYIGDSVTSIDYEAFEGCMSLTSFTMGKNVTELGWNVFLYCANISYEEYGNCFYLGDWLIKAKNNSVTNVSLKEDTIGIYNEAFYNCSSLTSVEIPEGVKRIGAMAFKNCSNLAEINIPNGVEFIGSQAFDNCVSLSYQTYGNCLYIDNWLIKANSASMTAVSIKNTTVGIYYGAFYNCGLTSVVIPNSVKIICGGAFSYCEDLVSVKMGEGILSIGNEAFRNCTNLVFVNIPNSVTIIEGSAFAKCVSLPYIVLGKDVKIIGYDAFYGCSKLTIFCEAEEKPLEWNYNWNSSARPVYWGGEWHYINIPEAND